MSLSLPLMNNLCKRWTLPEHIKKDCDFYFLRSYSDPDFVQNLKVFPDGTGLFIQEYGVNFQVLFQHGADKIYEKNGKLAERNEPNNTNYWCSFRSITFQWQGVACTKSYVLVQVDKSERIETRVPKALVAMKEVQQVQQTMTPEKAKHLNEAFHKAYPNVRNAWATFADKSQPRDSETPEIDEEV